MNNIIKDVLLFLLGIVGVLLLILFFFGLLFGVVYYISILIVTGFGLSYVYLSDVVILLWILVMLSIIFIAGKR